jgi:hypothetical protein
MIRGAKSKFVATGLIFSFLLFTSPYFLVAKSNMGSLEGLIFTEDGTTPLSGAVVSVVNVASSSTHKSEATNDRGSFRIEDLEKGVYVLGVSTDEGDFNANTMVGISENKTSKVSIALSIYDEKMQQAAQEVVGDQQKKGEALIGKVESYDAKTKIADVYILKGYLSVDDRVHVLGPKDVSKTDFRMDVKALVYDGKNVKRVFIGQTVQFNMKKPVVEGDLVYLVCRGFPIFLLPLGAALIVGGTALITGGDDTPTSPFRK